MRKFYLIAFGVILGMGLVPTLGFCDTLYDLLAAKSSVKVFVETPTDATGKNKILPDDLKKQIENALANRKSMSFKVVGALQEADIAVKTEVTGFVWMDHDPVDMIMGVGAVAWDAIDVEDYARMDAKYSVTDAKDGKTLSQGELTANVTKKDMTEKDSLAVINEEMGKVFVRRVVGKKKSR